MSHKKDRSYCKSCNHIIINTFKYCHHCGAENISLQALAAVPVSRTCTSFNDLDYNVITVITSFIHSKYEPLMFYEPDYGEYTKAQYNAENDAICILLSLNHHYRNYKAKNFYYRLNSKYSLKYYNDEDYFSLKMHIDNPSKQLYLDLLECDIEDVSVLRNTHTLFLWNQLNMKDVSALGNVHTLHLEYCTGITDVSALGKVHELSLFGCTRITDVSALGNVHKLHLNYCTGITDVSALGNVHKLHLWGCTGITDVSALVNVHELWLSRCTGITLSLIHI